MQRIQTGDGELVLLSPRERDVLALVAAGIPTKMIAFRLGISFHTVKDYIGRMIEVLGVENRVQLALWANAHPAVFKGLAVSASFTPPVFERVA